MSTTMRRFGRRIFLSTSACALVPGQAHERDAAAWELLGRVQHTYTKAVAYDLDFREKSSLDASTFDPYATSWDGRMACLEPHHFFYQNPLPENSRSKPARILCGNGSSVFNFSAAFHNEYIEEVYSDKHVAMRRTQGGDMFLRFHLKYVEVFRNVAERKQKEPRMLGQKKLKAFGREVECAVVETYPSDGSPFLITERLWIEPDTNRVLCLNRHGYVIAKGTGRRLPKVIDRTYRWRVLGQEMSMDIFRFVPPKGARFVEKFTPLPPRFMSYPTR